MKVLYFEIVYDVDYRDGKGFGDMVFSQEFEATDVDIACSKFRDFYRNSNYIYRILGVKPIIYRGSDGDELDKYCDSLKNFRNSVARTIGETEERN
jgi:hypothetical protein